MSNSGQAVFLSYASQDAEAAKKICDALRAVGVEVWFDQNELVGGDAWDAKIRKQIKECALFVPIISASTQARPEGYFRREWRLAVERMHDMEDEHPFLVPVVIDETPDAAARVPERFRERQWTRLPKGETPAAFLARLKSLLERGTDAPAVSDPPAQESIPSETRRPSPSAARQWWWLVSAAALVGGSLFFAWRRYADAKLPMPVTEQSPGRSSRPDVAALLARARALMDKTDVVRGDLDTANTLLDQAAKLEATDANVWAVWALLDRRYVDEWYDRSPARYDAAQRHARQAIGMDPASPMARFAQASSLVLLDNNAATKTEAIGILESALPELGREPRAFFLLASLKFDPSRPEAAFGYLDRAARVPGWAGRAEFERCFAYFRAREWEQCIEAIDRSLVIERSARSLLWKAYILTVWRGDTATAKRLIAGVPPVELTEDTPAAVRYFVNLWARDYEGAFDAMRVVPRDYIDVIALSGPTGYYKGYALARAGKAAAAAIEWRSALDVINRRLAAQPSDRTALEFKALLLAALGDTAGAQDLWRSQRELFGDTIDSWTDFVAAMQLLSEDDAIDQLVGAMKKNLPTGLAANLRLCPFLDRLRSNPRFITLLAQAEADPRLSPTAKPAHAGVTEPSAPIPDKSIAVLAFANLSDDKDNEYFSDGISEELISVLGRVPGLTVKGSISAFYFKHKEDQFSSAEIARQLGVTYLVRGSVRKAGDKVRITAQLTRATTDEVVWSSEPLTRDVQDMFAVQEEVARLIAEKLQLKLGGSGAARSAVNPEAYQLYLQARQAWNLRNADGYDRAEKLLGRSIALAPDFAPAHAALVDVWTVRGQDETSITRWGLRNSPAVARIIEKSHQAIALDPASAESHASLGGLDGVVWQLPAGERELLEAIRLNPNYASAHQWLGRNLMTRGRLDEALAELKQAAELDPLSPRILDNYSLALLNAQRPAEALELADRALRLQPNAEQPLAMKAVALAKLGEADAAAAAARSLSPAHALHGEIALVTAGKLNAAAALLASIPQDNLEARIAGLIGVGRTAEALAALKPELLVSGAADFLLFQPVFDPLRSDPRFRDVLKTVGLADANDRAQAWRQAHPPEKTK